MTSRFSKLALWIIVVPILASLSLSARPRSNKKTTKNAPAFSYYMLVLSYAPDFARSPRAIKTRASVAQAAMLDLSFTGCGRKGKPAAGPKTADRVRCRKTLSRRPFTTSLRSP